MFISHIFLRSSRYKNEIQDRNNYRAFVYYKINISLINWYRKLQLLHYFSSSQVERYKLIDVYPLPSGKVPLYELLELHWHLCFTLYEGRSF